MRDFLLSYDTVTLRPKHSCLKSRDDADTSITFLGHKFKLPVIPANMKDVISVNNAKWLSENGYFYIYHRFGKSAYDESDLLTVYFVKKTNIENWPIISISTGVGDDSMKELMTIKALHQRVDFITIDVAHADHENVRRITNYIKENFPNTKLIIGNVATGDGVEFLFDLGVDAIKVGIGGGSICSTRYMTGFHLPTLQSVYEANIFMSRWGSQKIPIIADGGSKHFGDVAKALVFGATMVMSGGWFASCIDSPAKIVEGKKVYRGSTSYELKGHHRHVEGIKLDLIEGSNYAERISEITDSIKSSISYAGGKDINAFNDVQWERILPFH